MMEVHYINREEEFAALEIEWNDLLHRSAADNPFLTHQWLHSWWRAFGRSSLLNVLLCRENSGGKDSLVGIFPGYITYNLFPPTRLLRFLGSEVVTSDFLDVIVERDREKEILCTLLMELRRDRSPHLIELTDLPESSPLLTISNQGCGQDWCIEEWPTQKLCPVISLPKDTAEYFNGLSRGVRKNFNYYRRRLGKQDATLEIIRKEEDLAQGIDDFSRLHNSRRNQKGQSGIFSSEAQRSFYSGVFGRFFQAGWLELAFLNIAGVRVAGACQFNYRNSVYYYQTGYDVSWEKSSVGFVLNGMLIERAIRQGKSFYEFLRGAEDYKYRLGATRDRQLRDLYLTRGSLPGETFLLWRRLKRTGRATVKAFLKSAFGSRFTGRKVDV
jgi:CelD/BcsL family acetyltransferase involved in cellulose biosynthesis